MRSRRLDVGIESISRWRIGDEDHLPLAGKASPKFLPKSKELDEILRRPTLDERLTDLLQPEQVDPDLLEPSVLSATRQSTQKLLEAAADGTTGAERSVLSEAARLLSEEVTLDQDIQAALAALLKG